jgi:hypothetical protein
MRTKEHAPLNTFQEIIKPIKMLEKLKSLHTDPLYRNSIAMMLNSAFAALFGLLFWIAEAQTMPSKNMGLATAAILAWAGSGPCNIFKLEPNVISCQKL